MTYANYAHSKSRQLRGAELIAAGSPELNACRQEDGRQRGATRVDGQISPTASVDQRTSAESIGSTYAFRKPKPPEPTPEERRFLYALLECPMMGEERIRAWIRAEAANGAATNFAPAFVTQLISRMLSRPQSSPNEVADAVAEAFSRRGGAQ